MNGHQSMSINQILQPTTREEEKKMLGKVKIFYTFKGSNTHCLCTFDFELDNYKDRKWISIPLKQCLKAVCSSCPDQLMNNNAAIYSANFEDSLTAENWTPLHDSQTNIIWEGHGVLSNILNDDNNEAQVTGKITESDKSSRYHCYIEVLIQLHPIHHSPLQQNYAEYYLPPMRSIWTDSSSTSPILSSRTSHPVPDRLPSLNLHKNEGHYSVFPPALDPNWPGSRYDSNSFEHEAIKRRKIAPNNDDNEDNKKMDTHNLVLINQQQTSSKSIPNLPNLMRTSLSTPHINPTFDTYYHQSRRKKRDTKPPNVNDVRPFVEIEKGPDGKYILPAEVDSWTVLSLGKVIWDKAAFHNQRYIYPVGYRVKKWYRSMVDPHSDTQYTCEILDGGDEPIFQLTADDNPNECWRGPTPTTVWTIAVRRAFAIRNMDYGHNPVGPDFFGLRKNTIAKMIQDLPDADKCKNYIWQNFEAMSNTKGKSVRRTNPTRLSSSSSSSSSSITDTTKLKTIEDESPNSIKST
ncbi:F/Y-rich N-terminus-domain-containing protein [Cokeromyces recurvatus]|uniref:F/Y-rich N-terminus-domain-containing protein n=1 Tax=Cokeromyces recurvatus TaxID=90255 RepID=UPI00221ED7CA|nr:F/Y-rich N-terminus-domain-containing protein [Cokeromyces recurvatus]KAI7901653.1 F/Y-rich N-terminus-domain-containing protein [Cokeromyces recurvatus]